MINTHYSLFKLLEFYSIKLKIIVTTPFSSLKNHLQLF